MAIVGSIRSMKLASADIPVMSEAEFKVKPKYETEAKATTGAPVISQEKMVEIVEGVQIDASDKSTYATLKGYASSGEILSMSFSTASGDVWSSDGTISLGEFSTKTGVAEISLIPAADWTIL